MSQKRKTSAEKYVVVAEAPPTLRVAISSFLAGAGLMWLGMQLWSSPTAPSAVTAGNGAHGNGAHGNGAHGNGAHGNGAHGNGAHGNGAPNISQMPPAQADAALGNWEYDRANWTAAIQHYEHAIGKGLDTADLRTDLGTSYRYLGDGPKALEQYGIAQRKDRFHQNSLFNQAVVYAEVLHDQPRAISAAREFLRRFPQSQGAESARKLIADLEANRATVEKKLGDFLGAPLPVKAQP